MPLTEVHYFVSKQTGDRRLAARDLTDAMANDRVRSMRRQVDRLLRRQAGTRTAAAVILGTEYELDGSSAELQVTERRGLAAHSNYPPVAVYERSGPTYMDLS